MTLDVKGRRAAPSAIAASIARTFPMTNLACRSASSGANAARSNRRWDISSPSIRD